MGSGMGMGEGSVRPCLSCLSASAHVLASVLPSVAAPPGVELWQRENSLDQDLTIDSSVLVSAGSGAWLFSVVR